MFLSPVPLQTRAPPPFLSPPNFTKGWFVPIASTSPLAHSLGPHSVIPTPNTIATFQGAMEESGLQILEKLSSVGTAVAFTAAPWVFWVCKEHCDSSSGV